MRLYKNLCLVVVILIDIVIECFMRLHTDIGRLLLNVQLSLAFFGQVLNRLNFCLNYLSILRKESDHLGARQLSIIS